MAHALLEMRGITKRFGAVVANDRVGLGLDPGDILGLLGENGAGKTTLMNILFGAYAPDEGEILVDGRPVAIHAPADALALGIGMVHQHFHLVPSMTVLENLMIGLPGRRGRLDRAGALARLRRVEADFGLALDPDALVSGLAIGQQQRLEILKVLFRGARIVILDEPTAVLTPQEAESLFQALRAMAAQGFGIIFISHKLHEVRALTTRVTVLRQGRIAASLPMSDTITDRQLAELMCGHELSAPAKPAAEVGAPLLSLDRVSTDGGRRLRLADVSLEVRAGEILGIAGVSGNGQRELADVVAGMLAPVAGTVTIDGRPVERFTPRGMQARRVGRVPEDRMTTGLITALPLSDSMVLPWITTRPFSRFGLIDHGAVRRFVESEIRAFAIRTPGPAARTGTLSGGNLQKALLARELARDPLVLLAAQPTRGLDVGAARFVHEKFLALRAAGRAVIVISEDLEELFQLSDRIAVMFEGRIMGTLPIAEASVARIGLMMSGAEGIAA
ncbi:ABC transporter ATP-binding protein [Zavarzinia compransoris]|uniref:ABC transporter ATP-binding protein n=1 Tax=Zavarzinia compransoris TaxID=1264899 RepID=A0A317DZJ2_9PROT|nr:ABC transporter ATP-binding protein [Zavarzinia compransoris]PWR19634.1 ABC transporter ATP-binding protein [Zavarzinia compransoris]TDP43425.1 nucleoside ABC transporter ATP-binding protein [Zavarzinia compransoris]